MALVLPQAKLNLSLKLKVQGQVQLIVVPASCLESDTSLKTIDAPFASLIVYVRNGMREKRGRAKTFYCSSPAISPQSRHKRLMCCQESITLCKVILPSHNPGFSQRPHNNLTARNLTKKGVYGIETHVKHILISPLISICVQALCMFKINRKESHYKLVIMKGKQVIDLSHN